MFKTKLYNFSSKVIYWTGLANVILPILAAFILPIMVLGLWIWLLLMPILNYFIWRGVLRGNKLSIGIQFFTLFLLVAIGIVVTWNLALYGLLPKKYVTLMDFWFLLSTIGIYLGIFLIGIYLYLPLGQLKFSMAGPVTIIMAFSYIAFLAIYWFNLRG